MRVDSGFARPQKKPELLVLLKFGSQRDDGDSRARKAPVFAVFGSTHVAFTTLQSTAERPRRWPGMLGTIFPTATQQSPQPLLPMGRSVQTQLNAPRVNIGYSGGVVVATDFASPTGFDGSPLAITSPYSGPNLQAQVQVQVQVQAVYRQCLCVRKRHVRTTSNGCVRTQTLCSRCRTHTRSPPPPSCRLSPSYKHCVSIHVRPQALLCS
jgi:hypothetical protein